MGALSVGEARLGATQSPDPSAAGEFGLVALEQSLVDLGSPYSLMCVASGPGGEDSDALVYYRRKLGVRTTTLFATNSNPLLPTVAFQDGSAATRDAIEVSAREGADAYFLNLPAGEYAESSADLSKAWDHYDALGRMVHAIRLLRPDVIITDAGTSSGNWVKDAVGNLLKEALDAAGQATAYPGEEPWHVRRIFLKTDSGTPGVQVPGDEYSPVYGATYTRMAELARAAGYGEESSAGGSRSHYQLSIHDPEDQESELSSLFDGLALPAALAEALSPPKLGAGPLTDSISQSDLLLTSLTGRLIEERLLGSEQALASTFGAGAWRIVRFDHALERCIVTLLGIQLTARLDDRILVPGDTLRAHLKLTNHSDRNISVQLQTPDSVFAQLNGPPTGYRSELTTVSAGSSTVRDFGFKVPAGAPLTGPRSGDDDLPRYFPVADRSEFPAETPFGDQIKVLAAVGLGPVTISLTTVVTFEILPPFELSASPPIAFIRDWDSVRPIHLTIRIVNHTGTPSHLVLWLVPQALVAEDYKPVQLNFVRKDQQILVPIDTPVPLLRPPMATNLLFELRNEGAKSAIASTEVEVKPAGLDTRPGLRIGYIPGPGSSLVEALDELGVAREEISSNGLGFTGPENKLHIFHTVVIDAFAFHTHKDLLLMYDALLDYVRGGGNLVILPQLGEDIESTGAPRGALPIPKPFAGPFADKPTAPISIVSPEEGALKTPNKIGVEDLKGWPRDPLIRPASEWAKDYTSLISTDTMAGAGVRSSLLLAHYGRGTVIYSSLNWRKALGARQPGAYRLLENLFALPVAGKTETAPVSEPTISRR